MRVQKAGRHIPTPGVDHPRSGADRAGRNGADGRNLSLGNGNLGFINFMTETFDNVAELCAAILIKGVATQIKRGLSREYISRTNALSFPRGKLDVTASIKSKAIAKKQLICTYDDFSVDNYRNRILKTTMMLLLRSGISKTRAKKIRSLLVCFVDITPLDVYAIRWNLPYGRNDQTYHMQRDVRKHPQFAAVIAGQCNHRHTHSFSVFRRTQHVG